MFPHNMIVLDLTRPARASGMLGGVLTIAGASIRLSVRYKEAKYAGPYTPAKLDWIGADYLPLMVLLGPSGFVLQGAILAYAYTGDAAALLWTAIYFHAAAVETSGLGRPRNLSDLLAHRVRRQGPRRG